MSTEIDTFGAERDLGYWQNVAERVLALCASHDPMFATPSTATTITWAGQFSETHLGYAELIAGVREFYREATGETRGPLSADIVRAARRVIIEQRERETPAQRAEREWERDCHIARSLGEDLPARPGGTKTGMPDDVREQLRAWRDARKPA